MSTWFERNPIIAGFSLLSFLLGVFVIFFVAASQGAVPSVPPRLPPSVYDARLLALDKEGIEQAYQAQVTLLFKNWMNDPGAHQPQRAITGLRNAARAYIEAMDGAKQREKEIRDRP